MLAEPLILYEMLDVHSGPSENTDVDFQGIVPIPLEPEVVVVGRSIVMVGGRPTEAAASTPVCPKAREGRGL